MLSGLHLSEQLDSDTACEKLVNLNVYLKRRSRAPVDTDVDTNMYAFSNRVFVCLFTKFMPS